MSQASPAAPATGSRMVAVLVTGSVPAAAPPGIEPAAFARALVEDTADLVAGLEMVTPAVAVSAAGEAALACQVEELVWPGTRIIRLGGSDRPGAAPDRADAAGADGTAEAAGADGRLPGPVSRVLGALADLGASYAAVLAADAPDLPPLLIGKLFRTLGTGSRADIAVCPAEGGGLVALAARLPAPGWLATAHEGPGCELDPEDTAERLRGAAPTRGAVRSGPGWHRMRSPEDVRRLDRGLEGWEATRELLFAPGPLS